MNSTADRVKAIELIDKAVTSGARRVKACEELGVSDRTYCRWTSAEGNVRKDARPDTQHDVPANKLSTQERQAILDMCNEQEFAHLPLRQIVYVRYVATLRSTNIG